MVNTIKFSQMTSGGDLANNDSTPGLQSGLNVLFNNPWTFLAPGSTADRPAIDPVMYYRLRLNTDSQLYEYYDAVLGDWVQLQQNIAIQGPFVIFTADSNIPGAQNLGLLSNGILKQTISSASATLNIAENGVDYYGPGFTGYIEAPVGIKDINGNVILVFQPSASAVNAIAIANSPTTVNPGFNAVGTDTNIGIGYGAKGSGAHIFYSTSVNPFIIQNGATYDRVNVFNFVDISGTFTYTFPASSGTIALTSGVASSITGTQYQVLVNGTFGTPETGSVTLTTPQNIDPTSSPTFNALTLTNPLTLANGGTNASLTASNGGIIYSNATQMQVLAGTATAGQMLRSGLSSAPTWSTAVWPATTSINQILYSSANNVVSGITTANGGVLVTGNIGQPSILPQSSTTGSVLYSTTGATPSWTSTTFPVTTTINQILYSSAINTVTGLATANNSVLVTSSGGVPSLSTTLPSGISATNMALTTPSLGTPSSGTLTSCTGLPISTGVSGLGTGVSTALAVNVGSAGAFVTFNGAGGTPSSMVGTNITGTAAGLTAGSASAVALSGITGLGTGVATALALAVTGSGGVVLASSPTLVSPALGTPSSGILSNCTSLPTTGLSGLGTGVQSALTQNVTGTGGIVLASSPTLVSPALGTVGSGNLANCTGYAAGNLTGVGTGVTTAMGLAVNGSGSIVLTTSATLVTPTLGAASATSITFSSTSGIIGTTTNNAAAAGSVGENITSTVLSGSAVTLTSTATSNITSISLTAGDWDVWGSVWITLSGTGSQVKGGISTSSATLPSNLGQSGLMQIATTFTTGFSNGFPVGDTTLSLATTTTVYLVINATFTVGATGFGFITARRVR